MTDFNVFDAKCMLGRHMKLGAGGLHRVGDLLDEMDHYGIAEAMVIDCLGRENHPADGNARIFKTIARQPRLHPIWSALPHGPRDEQPAPEVMLQRMRERRVGALWLFPAQYRFNLADWCVDALLEPLEEARVPVFIDPVEYQGAADATDWNGVVALCKRWPGLPVVVSEWRIRRTQRMLYRAFDACPNLHLELSGYWLHRGIEFITENWGARRLIFGSNWPRLGPHMTLATLTTAEISDADKRLIAGDNLRELIAWCAPEHPRVKLPPPADEFVAFGRSGRRPASMTFWDNHGHLGGRASHYHLPGCTHDGIVADMKRLGVRKTCVFSYAGVFSDEKHGNDVVAEAVRRHPDRFVGFTMLNPLRGEKEMIKELKRGAAMGLRGVKLIPTYQGYPEEGPLIDVACRWAHEHRQFILNHDWGSAAQLGRLLRTYPDACFFTGHTFSSRADVKVEYGAIMKKHANLFVCTCPLLEPRACEEFVAALGAERLLFGSDLQDLPIAWGLGPILFARISAAEKRLVLGGNLKRLMKTYSRKAR